MKLPLLLLLLGWLIRPLYAQNTKHGDVRELRGSGTLIRKFQTVAPFQSVRIGPFLSNVTIQVGGTQSTVSVQLDDNFSPFLRAESVNGVLDLALNDPTGKPFWLSQGTLIVSISTPSLNQLHNESNGNVSVNTLTGDSFALTNRGNGRVTLRGTLKKLDVVSEANGEIRAGHLRTDSARVTALANATIEVNARHLDTQRSAQATIRNRAVAAPRAAQSRPDSVRPASGLVTVILRNNRPTAQTITLRFIEPGNPVYGVVTATLKPGGNRRETYRIGTKIEQLDLKQQQVAMTGGEVDGRPIVTLKADDDGRAYDLFR